MGTAEFFEQSKEQFYKHLQDINDEKEQEERFKSISDKISDDWMVGTDSNEALVRRYNAYKMAKEYEESTGKKISDKYRNLFPSRRKSYLFGYSGSGPNKEEEELFDAVRKYEVFLRKAEEGKEEKGTNEVSKQLESVSSIASKKNGKKLLRNLKLID